MIKITVLAVIALSMAASVSGCGGKSEFDDSVFDESGGEAGGASATLTLDPATAATVTGVVSFDGAPPATKPIKQDSDPVCAAAASSIPIELAHEVVVTDGKLANVFVYISEGVQGKLEPPTDTVMIDQKGCRYHPHILGAVVGQPIVFRNSDATLHNIHASPEKNDGFNRAQAGVGQKNVETFGTVETMIRVSCDVHAWMRCYIGVLPHPFFATTSLDGTFKIDNLPPGKYTLTAWHEKYGEQKQQIEVKPKESKAVTFSFKAT